MLIDILRGWTLSTSWIPPAAIRDPQLVIPLDSRATTTPTSQSVVPTDQQANYTVEFKTDGTFASKVDCNQVSGAYTTTASGGLTIVPGPSQLAACPEGSLAPIFLAGLSSAASYAITDGALTITTQDASTLTFK